MTQVKMFQDGANNGGNEIMIRRLLDWFRNMLYEFAECPKCGHIIRVRIDEKLLCPECGTDEKCKDVWEIW